MMMASVVQIAEQEAAFSPGLKMIKNITDHQMPIADANRVKILSQLLLIQKIKANLLMQLHQQKLKLKLMIFTGPTAHV